MTVGRRKVIGAIGTGLVTALTLAACSGSGDTSPVNAPDAGSSPETTGEGATGSGGSSGGGGTKGELPKEWPQDVPAPEGMVDVVIKPNGRFTLQTLVTEDEASTYLEKLKSKGFTEESVADTAEGKVHYLRSDKWTLRVTLGTGEDSEHPLSLDLVPRDN